MSNKLAPSDKAYDYVIEKIKSGEWEQGVKIASENDLSAELEVSRVAVRQALEKLVALGLLVKKKGSGTYVNRIEAKTYLNNLMPILLLEGKDIFAVLEFRKYFEYGNITMFIENYDQAKYLELVEQFEVMKASVNNPSEFYSADFRFHSIIAEGTNNPIVIKINEILMDILFKHHEILNSEIGPAVGIEYHGRLLKSIEEQDKELAGLLMIRHIEAAINDLRNATEH